MTSAQRGLISLYKTQQFNNILQENEMWNLSYYDGSTFFYSKFFDFSERDDSYEFITNIIQVHKNNTRIETEANDLGHIEVKVIGDVKHQKNVEKLLTEIDCLYENCLNE
jgi:hypothetical protein